MANGFSNIFNYSSNEDALREAARRRLELQSRAAGRTIASAAANSASNPAAIARNVAEAQAMERQRVGADMAGQLAAAQNADRDRAAQMLGSLINAGIGIAGTVMPAAKPATNAVQAVTGALVPSRSSQTPSQGMGRALGDPSQGGPQRDLGPTFDEAAAFLAEGQPQQTVRAPSVQAATPPPPPVTPAPVPETQPTTAPGTLLERDRLREDSRYLDTLQGLLMGGFR